MSSVSSIPTLKVLTKREYPILQSVVDRIIPQGCKNSSIDLAQEIDSVLAGVRKELIRDFKLLLLIFEYGAPLFGFCWKRFTRMNPDEKDRYLACWEKSKISFKRMGFQALKRVALAAFYGSEESWGAIGYPGPWLDKGYPHDYQGKGPKAFERN